MEKLHIHDWDRWQTYRKDRGTPPWIKVHRNILSNPKWALLSDAEKGQLVSIWVVAADADGLVPSDPRMLRKICQLDELPDVEKFQQLGLLVSNCGQPDAITTPDGRQPDAPETETEIETEERRGEGEKEEPSAKIGKYAFEGEVVRITHEQQAKWQDTFSSINVIEHLKGVDRTYAAQKEAGSDTSYWFPRCAQALAKANAEALGRKGWYDV